MAIPGAEMEVHVRTAHFRSAGQVYQTRPVEELGVEPLSEERFQAIRLRYIPSAMPSPLASGNSIVKTWLKSEPS